MSKNATHMVQKQKKTSNREKSGRQKLHVIFKDSHSCFADFWRKIIHKCISLIHKCANHPLIVFGLDFVTNQYQTIMQITQMCVAGGRHF